MLAQVCHALMLVPGRGVSSALQVSPGNLSVSSLEELHLNPGQPLYSHT